MEFETYYLPDLVPWYVRPLPPYANMSKTDTTHSHDPRLFLSLYRPCDSKTYGKFTKLEGEKLRGQPKV